MTSLIKEQENNKIIWNLFTISSTSDLKNLTNKKKYSLMNITQYNIENNETIFEKQHNIPLNNTYFKNLYLHHFNIEKINKYTKIIPIYNEKNIYYIGIFNYISLSSTKKQITLKKLANKNNKNIVYCKNLFIELNNCMKHKKANFVKGTLKCDLNTEYLENDHIYLNYNSNNSSNSNSNSNNSSDGGDGGDDNSGCISDSDDNDDNTIKIKLKVLLKNIKNYFWYFEWKHFTNKQ